VALDRGGSPRFDLRSPETEPICKGWTPAAFDAVGLSIYRDFRTARGRDERHHPHARGYRVRSTEPGCHNLGRMILRHADAGGRPIDNAEFCLAHGRGRIERDRAAGLRVYDNRDPVIR
jgi:hypothetical protein